MFISWVMIPYNSHTLSTPTSPVPFKDWESLAYFQNFTQQSWQPSVTNWAKTLLCLISTGGIVKGRLMELKQDIHSKPIYDSLSVQHSSCLVFLTGCQIGGQKSFFFLIQFRSHWVDCFFQIVVSEPWCLIRANQY